MGRYNLGVAVLRRGATKSGGAISAINHTKVTEVYCVVSGAGTLVMGGDVTNPKPIPPDNELVTTVVGPGNNATFVKPATTRAIKTGDVVIIPAGVYHGFSDVPDHIEYSLGATGPRQGPARRLRQSRPQEVTVVQRPEGRRQR